MSHLVSSTAPIASAHTVKKYAGFGILGADIPASGEHGASPVLNDSPLSGSEYHWRLETAPSSGTVTIYPDLTFTHTGAADGTWTWQYRLFEDGVDQGAATVTDVFAAVVSLIIASAAHSHLADNLTIGTSGSTSLSVQEATHAHTADSLTLSVSDYLAIADALHAHSADNAALSTTAYLAIADSIHAHLADNIGLSTAGSASLAISDAFHGHSADGIALTLDSLLSISESNHAHFADALVLSIPSAPGSYPTAVEIAAAILAAAQITPIHANVKQMNDEQMIGNGSTGNKWRSHLVP